MPHADRADTARSDGPVLQAFGAGVWVCDGPTVPFYSFPYPTHMASIRLDDGGLCVWSPVALTAGLTHEVDALGPVRQRVSPNAFHHLFLGEWKSAYPQAQLHASPGLRRKRRDLAFDAELGDAPDAAWAGEIDRVVVRGSVALTEVVFFHRASGTALFADLIENLPADWFHGWKAWAARLDGIVAPNPSAPREWRASFLDRAAAGAALASILAWPIERVLIAHGAPAVADGAAFVRSAFDWLLGPPFWARDGEGRGAAATRSFRSLGVPSYDARAA